MSRPLEVGAVVADRYEVLSVLGRGGMGTVYEARHTTLKRVVALKTLSFDGALDATLVARFFLEAQSAASIGHPNIVEVFDLGRDAEVLYLAMEKLDGEELAHRIRRLGRLAPADVARIGADLADAIAAAHERDIVHRDLKPQNVFLAQKSRRVDIVKVLDFGIAKLASGTPDFALTRTGEVFGTPLYMSPEQMHGSRDLDGRTDIYSIGALLREALTGRPPFDANSYAQLAVKVLSEEPEPIESIVPDAPRDLAALIQRAMRKDRAARVSTARELSDGLAEIAHRLGATWPSASLPPAQRASGSSLRPAASGDSTPSIDTIALGATLAAPGQKPVRAPMRIAGFVGVGLAAAIGAAGVVAGQMQSRARSSSRNDPTRASRVTPTSPSAERSRTESRPAAPTPVSPTPVSPTFGRDGEVPPIRVRVDSSPPGAEVVLRGSVESCLTPCTLEIPPSGGTLVATRAGFRRATIELHAPIGDHVSIELARASTPGTSPPPLMTR